MLEDGRRVEQEVARLPEHERQLLIVVGHHLRLEDLLAEGHEAVDVLDGLAEGYSDFHKLTGFTPTKRCRIIFLKMFVKKVFQLIKPFLANLHSSSSKNYSHMYSMTPKKFYFFFYMSIKNTQNFTLISNPWT
jgi:hypothetical protein